MAKTDKICIVCGTDFKGTAKAEVCGATCRKKLQRLKAAGKKPEFALVGGKNTKLEKAIDKITSNQKFKKASKKALKSLINTGTNVTHVPTLVTGTNLEEVIEKVGKKLKEKKTTPKQVENRYLNERWKLKMGIK